MAEVHIFFLKGPHETVGLKAFLQALEGRRPPPTWEEETIVEGRCQIRRGPLHEDAEEVRG